MENLQINELKLLKAAMISFAGTARSDEPHWSYEPEFKELLRKINNEIEEIDRLTLEKRVEEAEDGDRPSSDND